MQSRVRKKNIYCTYIVCTHFCTPYPNKQASHAVAESIKSSVRVILYDAFRLHQPKARVDLKIKGNDTKLVFASSDYPIGHLKLVPYSKSITVAVEGKAKNSLSSVEVKVQGPKGVTYIAAVNSMGLAIDRTAPKPFRDNIVVPYWSTRPVEDKGMSNMRKSTMACTVTIGAGDDAASHKVTLPIIQNVKALKKGEELLLFHDRGPKSGMPAQRLEQPILKRPVAAPSRMQQVAKKRKNDEPVIRV